MYSDPDAELQSDTTCYLRMNRVLKLYKEECKTSIHTCSSNIDIHLPGAKEATKSCKIHIKFLTHNV